MAVSNFTRDTQVFQGTATASGGTYVVTLLTDAAPYTDQVIRLTARVYITYPVTAHLDSAAALIAEYVVENKNNTTTAAVPITTSANPVNSDTLGFFLTSRPETADTVVNTSTAQWAMSGSQAALTVTNNGSGSVAVDVTVVLEIERVGST